MKKKNRKKIKYRVQGERNINRFAELAHVNHLLLEKVKEKKGGWKNDCLVCLIITAFKMEAFANRIGQLVFYNWAGCEWKHWYEKYEHIGQNLEIEVDWGKRPYQTLRNLFNYRNAYAHGKSLEDIKFNEVMYANTMDEVQKTFPDDKVEKLCTVDFATRAYEDSSGIIDEIQLVTELSDYDLWNQSYFYSTDILKIRK